MLYDVPKIIFSWKIACHFLWCSDVTRKMWLLSGGSLMTMITKLPFLYCHYIKVGVSKQSLQTQITEKKIYLLHYHCKWQFRFLTFSFCFIFIFLNFQGIMRINGLWLKSDIILKTQKWKNSECIPLESFSTILITCSLSKEEGWGK